MAAGEAQPVAERPDEVYVLEALPVIGSRLQGRSAQDSLVPVDIIQGADLQTYGIRDMDSLLSATVPSYNVNQQPISDASTLVRPANLRGLPSDSTLVLVNGKRYLSHHFPRERCFGRLCARHFCHPSHRPHRSAARRSGGPVRLGAIAGILNFKLRETGRAFQTSYGQNYGDGDKVNVAANLGLPLTDNGFANFSFEFTNADETSRSVPR